MNDLSGFDRKFGLDFPPELVRELGEAMRVNAHGAERLAAYLASPPGVREAFDRRQKAAIERDLAEQRELDEWVEAELADDPIAQAVKRRRHNDRLIAEIVSRDRERRMAMRVLGFNWDEHWDRRVEAARRHPGRTAGYRRETDPLFDLDLREVWEQLTGEPVRGTVARCPHPDHEDCWPSCAVRARLWFCNGCPAGGSIIDLGALVYDLEPRGASFFHIREQLLAALGIEEAA